jgi:hypothetical protein
MIRTLFCYQLVFVALMWLCVMPSGPTPLYADVVVLEYTPVRWAAGQGLFSRERYSGPQGTIS